MSAWLQTLCLAGAEGNGRLGSVPVVPREVVLGVRTKSCEIQLCVYAILRGNQPLRVYVDQKNAYVCFIIRTHHVGLDR